MTTAAELVDAAALLNPAERMRHVATTAPRLAPGALAELAAGDWFARRLGVVAAAAVRDGAHLARALDDPLTRAHALDSASVPEEAIERLVRGGSLEGRRGAYLWLRRHRRSAVADRLVDGVIARWGDTEGAALLPACSTDVVAARLPALAHAVTGWRGLVSRHPDAVVAHVSRHLAALPPAEASRWFDHSSAALGVLARYRPADVLGWLERHRPTGTLPYQVLVALERLLAVDTVRTVAYLRGEPTRLARMGAFARRRSVRERLATLPDDALGGLLAASGPAEGLVAQVLRGLPPSRRAAVLDIAYAERDRARDVLPDAVVRVLPHARRHAEARRMLALPVVAADPATRLWAASLLPFAEAEPLLDEAVRARSADERALGYGHLVRAAAAERDPRVIVALLDRLGRLRNEQDPVRSHVLRELAKVGPELFPAESRPGLDALVTATLESRDASHASRSALFGFATRMLWHRAVEHDAGLLDWALSTVAALARRGGGTWHPTPLHRVLRRGQEHAMVERLLPYLEADLARGETAPLFALVGQLDRRAWNVPALMALLPRTLEIKRNPPVDRALALWLAPPRGRTDRVSALVADEPSLIANWHVLRCVVRRRPDLLEEYALSGRAPRGRFAPSGRWVPRVGRRDLLGWAPRQVTTFARLLDEEIADRKVNDWQRATSARLRVAVPGTDPAATPLVDHPEVLIAEAALTGLPDGDDPAAALPVLLARADGDRARVTLYAASRCARDVDPARLAALLGDLLANAPKVTARKEAARLLSTLRVPGAADALLAALERPDQHRDVRAAVIGALRGWPDDPRVWPVLDAAATGDRHVASALLGAAPEGLPEAHRRRYAGIAVALAGHPAEQVAVEGLRRLPAWAPWTARVDVAGVLRGALLDRKGEVWRAAASAAADPRTWTALPELPADLVRALLARAADDVDAKAKRDRPARQRLFGLLEELISAVGRARAHAAPLRPIVESLATDPTLVPDAAELSVALLARDDLVERLPALATLVVNHPAAAASVAEDLAERFADEPDAAEAALAALAGRDDRAAGLFAVALVELGGDDAGWSKPWRRRLRALRTHADPEVRIAALEVWTAEE
ncbi:hypothetical protein Val02_32740 [Virgisporangium aliadipatigenens]|uniref:HEAT repeat domain-containing protein n=1 Tax=Virgisporangium aliadipatigenens TaxID=741659 RepID=A0A8J3YMD2_9ACTN|nr:hypothetical protein [Virgisporangium aliadipatigenens]GIJ46388.1 hypothetical protein Val02_32740 [Virgisporangium aliadipatigenens]